VVVTGAAPSTDWLYWGCAAALLVPVWAYPCFPSQDGPAHLASAVLLSRYHVPGTRFHEFFEIRTEQIPNWGAQAILTALCSVVPPLLAEKVLVSGHLVLFALAFRYLAWGIVPGSRVTPLLALAVAFNLCVWMGFYSFCLGVDALLFCVGYVARRDRMGGGDAAVVGGVLVTAYFCHLLAFIVAAAAVVWLAVASMRGWRSAAWATIATAPAAILALDYFDRTGFFDAPGGTHPGLAWPGWAGACENAHGCEGDLLGPPATGVVPTGPLLVVAVTVLVSAGLTGRRPPCPPLRFVSLALFATAVYLVTPEHLRDGHGGYLRPRTALLAALLFLAALPDPAPGLPRQVCRIGAAALVLGGVGNVLAYVGRENRVVAEATAGVPAAGEGRVVYYAYPHLQRVRGASDPVRHAGAYYCIDGSSVLLTNYEAGTTHFPLVFRASGVQPARRFEDFPLAGRVDTVVAWEQTAAEAWHHPDFLRVFNHQRVSVYHRRVR
jgi:hypothetical protein